MTVHNEISGGAQTVVHGTYQACYMAPQPGPVWIGRQQACRDFRALFGRGSDRCRGTQAALRKPRVTVRLRSWRPARPASASAVAFLARLVAAYPDGQFHVPLALATGGSGAEDLVSTLLHACRGPLPQRVRSARLTMLREVLSTGRVLLLLDDVASGGSSRSAVHGRSRSRRGVHQPIAAHGSLSQWCTCWSWTRCRICLRPISVRSAAGPGGDGRTERRTRPGMHRPPPRSAHRRRPPEEPAARRCRPIHRGHLPPRTHGMRALKAGQSAVQTVLERSVVDHPRAGELPVTSVSCRTCPSPWDVGRVCGWARRRTGPCISGGHGRPAGMPCSSCASSNSWMTRRLCVPTGSSNRFARLQSQ